MANIRELPNTCSTYYLSRLSEMDDFKTLVQQGLDRQKKERDERAHQRVCTFMTSTVSAPIVRKLEEAGFEVMYTYWSHAHARKVYVLIRPVSTKEWKTLKAEFPVIKGTKKKASKR